MFKDQQNIGKMSILHRIYIFSAIPIEILIALFIDTEKFLYTWKHKRPQIAKSILRTQLEGSHFLILKYITKLQ